MQPWKAEKSVSLINYRGLSIIDKKDLILGESIL